MERYQLVCKHDRGGRLVDAQEFEHLRFDKDRFEPELLDELLRLAGNTVSVDGNSVVIDHLYTERRLTPLNLYVREADEDEAHDAVIDYGQAIKDLAATNIFPGDILLKNFGVTRHGRVVFYDYDELCLLTDCTFREMPQARTSDEELYAEPWFPVGENDVFPEELQTFLGLQPELARIFIREHGDLFRVAFWTQMQARHGAGEVIDILPYRESKRLVNRRY
jgi:isocitrate dehydrogenase kinase/phosphatase